MKVLYRPYFTTSYGNFSPSIVIFLLYIYDCLVYYFICLSFIVLPTLVVSRLDAAFGIVGLYDRRILLFGCTSQWICPILP
uniref:Predicted protein n=1 Tax=Hordeum vulgare subsp. vulgare TaxID=112509 RepID=F2CUV4_HORVV|nr:predicted protein [Hordeum vulgare subsp. vulgare]